MIRRRGLITGGLAAAIYAGLPKDASALFGVNQQIGFGAAGAAAATVTFQSPHLSSTSDLTTYTFSSAPLGTASGRTLLVLTIGAGAGALRTISTVTVAGNAATEVHQDNGNAGNAWCHGVYAIANSALPLGTETAADIVVTFSGAAVNCVVGVFAVYGSGTTATDSEELKESDSSVSITITNVAGGVTIASAMSTNTGADPTTVSWTGATERYDTMPEAGAGRNVMSAASDAYSTAVTGRTITATSDGPAGTTETSVIGVSYPPA